ncbi:hypothetical protein IT084_01950 [Desulfallas sp. Bu1-1]|jgi:hypothetical protein|uniref:hypothetical protein n=1 Tax=Desulfallas sp. Bu1-1 TaxID=2787620 RepID=UPI00189EEE4E|nr:hypothetical protein [Desulfallas sp. Bu1-1]MBF7081744.1 hypothetical protein [Desulfallas sp. Bu1-1]
MGQKNSQSKKTAMLQALLCLIGTAVLYFIVFTNSDQVTNILKSKSYYAPLTSISIVLLASFLYGTAVSNILKHTLQERLKSQELREE